MRVRFPSRNIEAASCPSFYIFDGSQDWVIAHNDVVAGSNPASGTKCRSSSVVEHVFPVRLLSVVPFQRAVDSGLSELFVGGSNPPFHDGESSPIGQRRQSKHPPSLLARWLLWQLTFLRAEGHGLSLEKTNPTFTNLSAVNTSIAPEVGGAHMKGGRHGYQLRKDL